jgi:hypothetical protein
LPIDSSTKARQATDAREYNETHFMRASRGITEN